MEVLAITCLLSLIFGALTGSYFRIAAFNDERILNSSLFRYFYATAALLSLSILSFYVFMPPILNDLSLMIFHLTCFSIAFLSYSSSYLLAHNLMFKEVMAE